MSRISDASSINALINQMLKTEARRVETNYQVVSGKVSPNYAGVATEARRLVNLETTRDLGERFIRNNESTELRLNATALALDSIDTTIRGFRKSLLNFKMHDHENYDQQKVEELQKYAFTSLKALESYLNTDIDGQYLFAGSKVNTEPVYNEVTTLSGFQSKYDGSINSYPTTRDAHISLLSISNDTEKEDSEFVNSANWLTFLEDDDNDATNGGTSSIESTSALFSDYQIGSRITVTGTTSNDGDYTIQSKSSDNTKIYIVTEMLTDETLPGGLSDDTAQTSVTFDLPDGTQLTRANTGNINFDRAAKTITATTGNAFSNVNIGDVIEVGGAGAANGSYKISSIDTDKKVLTISPGPSIGFSDGTQIGVNQLGRTEFNRSGDMITAEIKGVFSSLSKGDLITVSDTALNDGSYTVASISSDGTQITIANSKFTDEGTTSGTTHFDYTVGSRLVFTTSTDTIKAQDVAGNALSGVFSTLKSGDSITINNSPTNDGTYTIGSVSSDGSTITLSGSTQLLGSDETDTNGTAVTVPLRGFAYDSGNEIVFNNATDTISLNDITTSSSATKNIFDNLRSGLQISISGTANNDGVYTIDTIASNGASFTVTEDITTAETFDPSVAGTAVSMQVYAADGTISASQSYYRGDSKALTHRIDDTRTLDIDLTAIHPTFEKTIRAFGLIAQGSYGSEGSLENNKERISQAMFLLDDALDSPSEGTEPFGTELQNDFEEIIFDLGFKQSVLRDAVIEQKDFNELLNGFIARTENVDETEAITNLLEAQRALEASYQAMSRVFSLSLGDYL